MRELVVAASTGLLFAHTALRDGRLDPAQWEDQLRMLKRRGFAAIDLSELWLPMADLSPAEVDRLRTAIAAAGLDVAGMSIVDIDFSRHDTLERSRQKVLRGIEVAAALGTHHLSLGFHPLPMRGPAPQRWVGSDSREHALIGTQLAVMARRAAEMHLTLSLEMFECGILDRSANVLAILEAADTPTVGANPDLANLLRAPWPLVEGCEDTVRHLAPHIKYWHVKNGVRMVLPDGTAIYQPTDLASGSIDYRSALAVAVRHGYRGPLVIEHYGGDAVAQASAGREYLELLIDDVCNYERIDLRGNA